MGERPLDVYPSGLQRFLTFVLPVAGLTWFPASLVLGKIGGAAAWAFPLVLLLFAWFVAKAFRAGLRRYDSAMG